MDIIFEIILGVVARYPVAFIFWMFGGFKKGKFKTYLKIDGMLSILILGLIILLIILVLRFF